MKALHAEDHFEIREYNIDVLKDEEESSLRVQERPYPIYPAKGVLTPKFIGDVISRFCFSFLFHDPQWWWVNTYI